MSDCITYDLKTCTNDCLGQKYVYVFFMIFSHFKGFINIHGYPNQIQFAYVSIE